MFTMQNAIETHDKPEKEAIHSGHFMVSHFEAEAQDDEDELAIPLPEVAESKTNLNLLPSKPMFLVTRDNQLCRNTQQQLAIDTSLAKLFQCMSLAYRQKLTSPKWNRFRGIRLRWKDKIRLNNVIWRCWHMQFIKNQNTLICQFASPLDVNTHNKPEAVVLEGKYWKRKLAAVTAEYKKWRMFYRNQTSGQMAKDSNEMFNEIDMMAWNTSSSDNMMVDEDYMGLMSDTLFSTITKEPFVFPDSREMARASLADFIQPSLGPLQPNLDDYDYMDTFEPLQDFISGKLPTVPEEHGNDNLFKQQVWCYPDLDLITSNAEAAIQNPPQIINPYQSTVAPVVTLERQVQIQDTRQPIQTHSLSGYGSAGGNIVLHPSALIPRQPPPPPPYQSTVISKSTNKQVKNISPTHRKISSTLVQSTPVCNKPMDFYQNYATNSLIVSGNNLPENRLALADVQVPQTRAILPQLPDSNVPNQGYKFPSLGPVSSNLFTSQKEAVRLQKGRQRSRSTSREPSKRPPLLSAVSDPQLVSPNNSVLLTQLLTNSSENVFATSQALIHEQTTNPSRIKEENVPFSILPQPKTKTPTSLLITTPINMSSVQQTAINDQLLHSCMTSSNSPSLDSTSQNLNSPTSSQSSLGSPNRETPHREKSRVGHIHAEQKRRYNIKNGFDMIHSLIPHLNQNPNAKLSKAAMLQKGAEYIRQLRSERSQLKEEMDSLRQQIESLNTSISNCQSLLPATGAPVSRKRDGKMQDLFDEYVKTRTGENWKFWIFSLLFRPLLVSFNNFVSTSSLEDLYRSTLLWIEQHCTLVDLRPVVLNSLRYLCTKTDILSEPEKLPDEARQAVVLGSKK